MRISYVANARIPTEKAHGIQIMEMCGAFAAAGHEVELIVPRRKNSIDADPFAYYGKPQTFRITRLPDVDLLRHGPIGFVLQSLQFAARVAWYLRGKEGLVYSRDEYALALICALTRRKCHYEAHDIRRNILAKSMLKRVSGIVAITQGLKERFIADGIDGSKILVAADGVDLAPYAEPKTKKECRERLRLPLDKGLVVYTGHLYKWKGAEILAQAALELPQDVRVVFVGGTVSDITVFNSKFGQDERIIVTGHRPHSEIADFQMAADVLAVPNTQKAEISARFTSPMKLFEYMASERPIVASDLPSLREVLNPENALLVRPDDPKALAGAILELLGDQFLASRLATVAKRDVQGYTWEKRARKLLENFCVGL
jgi:glycosyltransferase involved in cell wall biosynthesis